MNERIKELASCNERIQSFFETGPVQRAAIEQFAEFIVRECLARGKLTQSQIVFNGSEEYNAGREMGIEVFMNQIKQHFGIEE